MQERRVTTFGETRPLPSPFFVLATQNPIELEGTYPLPEAQLDRFMFKVDIAGVDQAVLEEILTTRVHGQAPPLEPVLTARELADLFAIVDQVHLPRGVANYIARLVAATHPGSADAPEAVKAFVKYGSSPRAAIAIGAASRGLALAAGQAQRRLRRRPARGRTGDRASAGARLRRAPRGLGRPARRRRAARGDSGDRARTPAHARNEVDVASGIGLRRVSKWIVCSCVLVCASGAVPSAREYRTVEVESLRVTIDSDWVPRTTPGYLPIRFDITNLGEARVIEIVG